MNQEIISQEELKNIFYGSYSAAISWDVIDDLYIAIHRNWITYNRDTVATIDHYHKLIDMVGPSEGLGPQTAAHMALKRIAQEWLRSRYQVDSITERYFAGFHPDVMSVDSLYIIECGTTDAGSIHVYLNEPSVRIAGNISYPFADELDIYFHSFQKGPDFTEWQNQNISHLRQVFRSRK